MGRKEDNEMEQIQKGLESFLEREITAGDGRERDGGGRRREPQLYNLEEDWDSQPEEDWDRVPTAAAEEDSPEKKKYSGGKPAGREERKRSAGRAAAEEGQRVGFRKTATEKGKRWGSGRTAFREGKKRRAAEKQRNRIQETVGKRTI